MFARLTSVLMPPVLLMAQVALAAPCGTVSLEGQCDGQVRSYCNADELKIETCDGCCGWNGKEYACLESCPVEGECIEECLQGTDVFGCSLMNTHEWTCAAGTDGCTDRLYVQCGADEICDEGNTHKCTPISQVDLCGGIPRSGICSSGVFKRCVNNQIEATDCQQQGTTCIVGQGCSSECAIDCIDGEAGCHADGKAWICTENPLTGCWEKAAKSCGAKVCHEGVCYFSNEVPTGEEEEDMAAPVVEEDTPAAPEIYEEPAADSGGCFYSSRENSVGGTTLITLVTLLGVGLLLTLTRSSEEKPKSDQRSSKQPPS